MSRAAARSVLRSAQRAELEGRIEAARELMGGRDAVQRFLQWTAPAADQRDDADDEMDGSDVEDDDDDEDDDENVGDE